MLSTYQSQISLLLRGFQHHAKEPSPSSKEILRKEGKDVN